MMQDAPQFSSREAHICIVLKRVRYRAYSLPMILRPALCVVLVVSATAAHADPPTTSSPRRSQPEHSRLSLAVLKNGKIVKAQGYGLADTKASRRDA